jgi:acyl-CoA synthetase (AMP-forming)/AMP-acid ligase II
VDVTLAAALRAGAERNPDAPLVFHSTAGIHETDLATVRRRALRCAAGLVARGVRPGQVVAVQLPNGAESVIAQSAVLLCGAVLLPVVGIYRSRELGFILRQSGAVALITESARAAEVLSWNSGTTPAVVVCVGADCPEGAVPWPAIEAAAAHPGDQGDPTNAPDDLAVLVYTSGTTGEPKGVQHSHRSLLAEVAGLPAPADGTVYLTPFPPGHIAALGNLLRTLVRGTPTVFLNRWDPETALDLVHRYGVTASAGVPFHLGGLLDAAEHTGRGVGALRDYLVGAAAVAPVLIERAERVGIRAYRAYGSSEHPTITSGRPEDPLAWRAHTDGRPMPGCEIRIADPVTGAAVPQGGDGEILARGPEQFTGYRDQDLDLDRAVRTEDGWLRTGDIGRIDANGCLTVTDRLKDLINRGGEKIASKEVEDILATHPAVAEAAVIGEPDPRYGERVCAFVVLRAGAELTPQEVSAHFAAAGAARQKTPERLVTVAELPRTPAGKVRKPDLRARLDPPPATGSRTP